MSIRETIVNAFTSGDNGPTGRSYHIGKILPELAVELQGDFLEIGAGAGDTTTPMAKAAKKTGRKVHVVDPWIPEMNRQVLPWTQKDWEDRLKYHEVFDAVILYIAYSQNFDFSALPALAFAFVDGGQRKWQVYDDVKKLAQIRVPVICVDDHRRNFFEGTESVKQALELIDCDYGYVYDRIDAGERSHEAYLVRKDVL